MIKILAAFVAGSAGLLLALHPASSNAASNFTVSASGGFIDPNGQQWTMRGLNAGVQDALQGFPNVMTDYPGMTAIRLNVNPSQDSSSSIAKVVQEYTAAGVVVQIEDHSGNGDNVAWYQQMATAIQRQPARHFSRRRMSRAPIQRQPRRTKSGSSTLFVRPGSPTRLACSRTVGTTFPTFPR